MGKKKHEKGAGSTPATVQLEQAGIPFKTYEYAHSNDHMDDGYGVEAATKLGFDEHQVFKTLRSPKRASIWAFMRSAVLTPIIRAFCAATT